jgi:hypothetical protein
MAFLIGAMLVNAAAGSDLLQGLLAMVASGNKVSAHLDLL